MRYGSVGQLAQRILTLGRSTFTDFIFRLNVYSSTPTLPALCMVVRLAAFLCSRDSWSIFCLRHVKGYSQTLKDYILDIVDGLKSFILEISLMHATIQSPSSTTTIFLCCGNSFRNIKGNWLPTNRSLRLTRRDQVNTCAIDH